jgi:hypothetical protein
VDAWKNQENSKIMQEKKKNRHQANQQTCSLVLEQFSVYYRIKEIVNRGKLPECMKGFHGGRFWDESLPEFSLTRLCNGPIGLVGNENSFSCLVY